jgi:hypothetical protein
MKMLEGIGLEALRFVPIEWDYLRYSLVADLSRMQAELAFSPIYAAADSLREFAGQRGKSEDGGPEMARDEAWLKNIIERRQRKRERQTSDQGAVDAR